MANDSDDKQGQYGQSNPFTNDPNERTSFDFPKNRSLKDIVEARKAGGTSSHSRVINLAKLIGEARKNIQDSSIKSESVKSEIEKARREGEDLDRTILENEGRSRHELVEEVVSDISQGPEMNRHVNVTGLSDDMFEQARPKKGTQFGMRPVDDSGQSEHSMLRRINKLASSDLEEKTRHGTRRGQSGMLRLPDGSILETISMGKSGPWRIRVDDLEYGPTSVDVIKELFDRGLLNEEDEISDQGMWKRIGTHQIFATSNARPFDTISPDAEMPVRVKGSRSEFVFDSATSPDVRAYHSDPSSSLPPRRMVEGGFSERKPPKPVSIHAPVEEVNRHADTHIDSAIGKQSISNRHASGMGGVAASVGLHASKGHAASEIIEPVSNRVNHEFTHSETVLDQPVAAGPLNEGVVTHSEGISPPHSPGGFDLPSVQNKPGSYVMTSAQSDSLYESTRLGGRPSIPSQKSTGSEQNFYVSSQNQATQPESNLTKPNTYDPPNGFEEVSQSNQSSPLPKTNQRPAPVDFATFQANRAAAKAAQQAQETQNLRDESNIGQHENAKIQSENDQFQFTHGSPAPVSPPSVHSSSSISLHQMPPSPPQRRTAGGTEIPIPLVGPVDSQISQSLISNDSERPNYASESVSYSHVDQPQSLNVAPSDPENAFYPETNQEINQDEEFDRFAIPAYDAQYEEHAQNQTADLSSPTHYETEETFKPSSKSPYLYVGLGAVALALLGTIIFVLVRGPGRSPEEELANAAVVKEAEPVQPNRPEESPIKEEVAIVEEEKGDDLAKEVVADKKDDELEPEKLEENLPEIEQAGSDYEERVALLEKGDAASLQKVSEMLKNYTAETPVQMTGGWGNFKKIRKNPLIYATKDLDGVTWEFIPDQDYGPTWRSDYAMYQLCGMIACGFSVPEARLAKISISDFTKLGGDEGDVQKNNDYVDGVLRRVETKTTPLPIEDTSIWRGWLKDRTDLNELQRMITAEDDAGSDKKIKNALIAAKPQLIDLARIFANVLTVDFLTNNFGRFAKHHSEYGTNLRFTSDPFKVYALNNEFAFQARNSTRVRGRFKWTDRYGKKLVESIKNLDPEIVTPILFPNTTAAEKVVMNVFWGQRAALVDDVEKSLKSGDSDTLF